MKCAFCGVGNRIRGDDAVGPVVVDMLKKELASDDDYIFLDCGAAPENFAGKVVDFSPDKVFVIDAVELGDSPGSFEVVDTGRIVGVLSSTHQLPLSLFVDYLARCKGLELVFVGVQPKNMGFDEKMSAECKKACTNVVGFIKKMIG